MRRRASGLWEFSPGRKSPGARRLKPAVILAFALLLSGCDVGCSKDEIISAVAPDERVKAVRFVRWCDPDGEHFTHISILGRWSALTGAGNAFRCDAQPDEVRMMWEGNDRLRVSYPRTAKVQLRASPVEGVTIDYVAR